MLIGASLLLKFSHWKKKTPASQELQVVISLPAVFFFVKMASFAKRVATTYVTFVGANALSNFVLFPSYKLDYGFLNEYLGRDVNNTL